MSDIFREVDEDIRQEKYRRLWNRFGLWIIGFAVLIVVGTAGYRGFLYWQETQSEASGDRFFDAVELSEAKNYQDAAAIYKELESSVGGYPALARFRAATDLASSGEATQALAAFDALSNDGSLMQALRDMAALRAGYLAVDTQDYPGVADRVERLTGDTSPFRAAARELLALSAWKNGDIKTAQSWITALEEDQETPVEVSRRISILNDVIRAANGGAAADGEGSNQ